MGDDFKKMLVYSVSLPVDTCSCVSPRGFTSFHIFLRLDALGYVFHKPLVSGTHLFVLFAREIPIRRLIWELTSGSVSAFGGRCHCFAAAAVSTGAPLDSGLESIARTVLVPTAQRDKQLSSCSLRKASFVFLVPWLAFAFHDDG